jgi:hypothetical protein
VGLANLFSSAAGLALLRESDIVTAKDALSALARPVIGTAALALVLVPSLHRIEWGSAARLSTELAVTCLWLSCVWIAWPKARAELKEHFLWKGR